jgi:hypothetical protein
MFPQDPHPFKYLLSEHKQILSNWLLDQGMTNFSLDSKPAQNFRSQVVFTISVLYFNV